MNIFQSACQGMRITSTELSTRLFAISLLGLGLTATVQAEQNVPVTSSETASGAAINASTKTTGLSLDLSQISVSGLSSGGYMAAQFHLANSEWVSGVGLIGTGPYYCAQNDIGTALAQCVGKASEFLSLAPLMDKVADYQASNKLAPASSNQGDKVWILHGTNDTTINRQAADLLAQQYQALLPTEHIVYVSDKPFAHLFPTVDKGGDCEVSAAPFIGSCGYDAAGIMLSHIIGPLQAPASVPDINSQLISIDQQALGGDKAESLADEGFVFIPSACAQGESCKVHVSFHGCNQNAQAVGQDYARLTGLNEWAQSNALVVLYPQTKKSMFMPLNPQACWDWWGYTGDNYATKDAAQIQAVAAMVQKLNTLNTQARNR